MSKSTNLSSIIFAISTASLICSSSCKSGDGGSTNQPSGGQPGQTSGGSTSTRESTAITAEMNLALSEAGTDELKLVLWAHYFGSSNKNVKLQMEAIMANDTSGRIALLRQAPIPLVLDKFLQKARINGPDDRKFVPIKIVKPTTGSSGGTIQVPPGSIETPGDVLSTGAIIVRVPDATSSPGSDLKINTRPIQVVVDSEVKPFCTSVIYSKERALDGWAGSGFLVDQQNLVATAHHVVEREILDKTLCPNLRVIFGFGKLTGTPTSYTFAANQVYTVKRIEPVTAHWTADLMEDAVVLVLDRPVELGVTPLSIEPKCSTGDKVVTFGFPRGMPMMVCETGVVSKSSPSAPAFSTDLDIYIGQSGSPIVKKGTNKVVGLVSRSDADDFISKKNKITVGLTPDPVGCFYDDACVYKPSKPCSTTECPPSSLIAEIIKRL